MDYRMLIASERRGTINPMQLMQTVVLVLFIAFTAVFTWAMSKKWKK
jgi:hypothetical protein